MIIISAVMFFIATFHLVMNAYRLVRGYVDDRLAPGGPVAYIGNLRLWDHILKDTLYATQENLGSAAAVRTAAITAFIKPALILLQSPDLQNLGAVVVRLEDYRLPHNVVDSQSQYVNLRRGFGAARSCPSLTSSCRLHRMRDIRRR